MRSFLIMAALLGSASLLPGRATAQKVPAGVFLIEGGYQVVNAHFQRPTRLATDNQFTVKQPLFRYRGCNPKSLVFAELSGVANGTYGRIIKRVAPGYLSSGQVGSTGTYGQDQTYASLLIAGGSTHLKIGGEVVFGQFGLFQAGLEPGITPGVIQSGTETLVGVNLHYTTALDHRAYFRAGLYGDRIFHETGIRGYAATLDATLVVNLVGHLNLVAEAKGQERAYAGQHTGTPSPFSTDPKLLDGFSPPENLPVRVMSTSFSLGLALGFGY